MADRKMTRRGFLKAAGAGAAALAAASAARTALAKGPHPGDPGAGNHRWVMVIDLARCDGCQDCTAACSAMHMVPPGQEWIKVYEMDYENSAEKYFFPRP